MAVPRTGGHMATPSWISRELVSTECRWDGGVPYPEPSFKHMPKPPQFERDGVPAINLSTVCQGPPETEMLWYLNNVIDTSHCCQHTVAGVACHRLERIR